jgi:hypothetical protein
MRYSIGHPAYKGANRYMPNLNQGEAMAELLSRGVAPSIAERLLRKAAEGSYATGLTIRSEAVEVVSYEAVRRVG